ncbi:hypothetical protein X794_05400 [Dehalococcoides mccartyi CG5]|jgi:hypothetical protein|nr:hypothetical protein X794_05400 [Dehalococcoides mccartyi CG5]
MRYKQRAEEYSSALSGFKDWMGKDTKYQQGK